MGILLIPAAEVRAYREERLARERSGLEEPELQLGRLAHPRRVPRRVEHDLDPAPIAPAAHYAMGGIPTDINGRVIIDEKNTVLRGLYAAGECACPMANASYANMLLHPPTILQVARQLLTRPNVPLEKHGKDG